MAFDFASTYSGAYFFINVNTFKHTHTQIFFFCKEENEILRTFIHLESCDKNVHLYDSTMWCVRVCICYVGWQNTSYTVDTACTPSLSGLATAIHRCTLHFHCEMPLNCGIPGWHGPAAALFFMARWTQQAKSSVRRVSIGEAFGRQRWLEGALAVTVASFLRWSSPRARLISSWKTTYVEKLGMKVGREAL